LLSFRDITTGRTTDRRPDKEWTDVTTKTCLAHKTGQFRRSLCGFQHHIVHGLFLMYHVHTLTDHQVGGNKRKLWHRPISNLQHIVDDGLLEVVMPVDGDCACISGLVGKQVHRSITSSAISNVTSAMQSRYVTIILHRRCTTVQVQTQAR